VTTRPPTITDPDQAARLLAAGGLVAIPTETVYGLAARIDRPHAVARVFAVKGRPTGHPLIVHLHDADDLARWVSEITPPAARLAAACWPGPLTLLLRRSESVPDAVTGGRDTVGIRVPAHPLTDRLLALVGTGLAAPSANRFGKVSPTTAEHVVADLGDLLDPAADAILDGGPCPVGVESTIVDCTVDPPQVLRHGGIPVEAIRELLGLDLASPSGESRASGMLAAHYAPDAVVRLVPDRATADAEVDRLARERVVAEVLDVTADLVAGARELYVRLRDADHRGVQVVVAVEPPAAGLGHALRDRLVKAAAGTAADRPSRGR
jgi:L-threonylcarbamoyladenylate synthase